MNSTLTSRQSLQQAIFPQGIPRLWSPTLTHFCAPQKIDAVRIGAHLTSLAPHVRGILVPGSTGEGWEMSDEHIQQLLAIVLPAAQQLGLRVLIGVLKTNVPEVLATLDAMSDLQHHSAVAGITVCPPKGEHLTQTDILQGLSQILDRGWPTALYQLPQVTQNRMSPETVSALAAKYPNFLLFKDTSGEDLVANSTVDLDGVFLVRGAEKGGYAPWPRTAGGPYDGFLLSTANGFAPQLDHILRLLDAGDRKSAFELSQQLSTVVTTAFDLVATLPAGNPFANANKLVDHFLAYGRQGLDIAPPLLFSGARLPAQLLPPIHDLLSQAGWLPELGYLASHQ